MDAGLVNEQGEATGAAHGEHGGRPPVPLSLDKSAGVALGVDFGHTHLRVAVADLSHDVLAEAGSELDVDHSADEGLDVAAEMVGQVLRESGITSDRVIGVGMGLPGPINTLTGTIGSSSILPGWVGVDVAAEMTRRLGLAVQVENDANLGALAEFVWGSGQGHSRARVHQALLRSRRRPAPRRTPLSRRRGHRGGDRPHPRTARRGDLPLRDRGCLETVASARSIAELLGTSRGEEVDQQALLELSAAGDPAAQRLIGRGGPRDRDRGRRSLQPDQPRPRDRRRRAERSGRDDHQPDRGVDRALGDPIGRRAGRRWFPGVLGERAELLGALALVLHVSDRFVARPAATLGKVAV